MTNMRWFTDAAYDPSANWESILNAYARHLDRIKSSLPPALARFASEASLNLHDAEIHHIDVLRAEATVTIVANVGDLEVGYRQLRLVFTDAALAPDNLQLLAYAINTRYHSDHWGDATTTVMAQEIDLSHDGRFIVRLRLWPFHTFAVEFGGFALTESPGEPQTGTPGTLSFQ